MALVHDWEELDSLPVKIISSLWVCSLSKINLFLPFCIMKDFDEDMLCRHLRPNLGLREQKPCTLSAWRTTHVEPSPTHIYLGDSSGHFSQKVAKFWREECSETVLTAKKDEQNSLEMPHARVYLSWQSCLALQRSCWMGEANGASALR